jgi:hypothetical protein
MSRDRFPLVPFAQVAEIAQGESGTGVMEVEDAASGGGQ